MGFCLTSCLTSPHLSLSYSLSSHTALKETGQACRQPSKHKCLFWEGRVLDILLGPSKPTSQQTKDKNENENEKSHHDIISMFAAWYIDHHANLKKGNYVIEPEFSLPCLTGAHGSLSLGQPSAVLGLLLSSGSREQVTREQEECLLASKPFRWLAATWTVGKASSEWCPDSFPRQLGSSVYPVGAAGMERKQSEHRGAPRSTVRWRLGGLTAERARALSRVQPTPSTPRIGLQRAKMSP